MRLSKFYKHCDIGVFGTIATPYLIERKDGRFYEFYLIEGKAKRLTATIFYEKYREWIKMGKWVETTPEKELAAL